MVKSPDTQMLQPMHSRDVLDASFGDLSRQKRISNGRARAADQIDETLADDGSHAVGGGIAADTHHGLRGELLDAGDEGLLPALLAEAGRQAVILPAGQADIPEVRDLGDESDHVLGLGPFQPCCAPQLVHGEPAGDGTTVAHRFLGVDQEFLEKADAVFERSAILVGAVVEFSGKELVQEAQCMARIDVDQVELRTLGAERRRLVPATDVADVLLVHGPRLHGVVGKSLQSASPSAPSAPRANRGWVRSGRYRQAPTRRARRARGFDAPFRRASEYPGRPRGAVR